MWPRVARSLAASAAEDHVTLVAKTTLDDVHRVFTDWFSDQYDLAAIAPPLATKAAEQLSGGPLWTLLISGSGNAKTETVCALSGAGALIVSTITSDGALLSASPKPGQIWRRGSWVHARGPLSRRNRTHNPQIKSRSGSQEISEIRILSRR